MAEGVLGGVLGGEDIESESDAAQTQANSDAFATAIAHHASIQNRKYTIAEKRAIVEETRRRGASVAEVAQRHGVNANLLFGWRRLYQQGVLREESSAKPVALLPVKVTTPTLVPTEREVGSTAASKATGSIEIEFAGGWAAPADSKSGGSCNADARDCGMEFQISSNSRPSRPWRMNPLNLSKSNALTTMVLPKV